MQVSQMSNGKGGTVKNQFIIFSNEATVFQSYESPIARITWEDGKRVVTLDQNKWNYSKTTSKYRNQFLGETTKETEAKIKLGEYRLADLTA